LSRKAPAASSGKRRSWLRWLALALLALLILPIAQVGCVRWIDPPGTPLMLLRKVEAKLEHRAVPQTHFAWLDYSRIPREFIRCVLTSEDQRFFTHDGFDWKEIEVAQREAARKKKPVRGASTISMQCARSLFLWQGRSWIRKGLEAYYTFWMEALLSKRRILELYCNVIELGDGVYGVEAGAQHHFRRSAANLTREQHATLAAILPNPRVWNPRTPTAKVAARRAKILRREPALRVPL
jgi:monofunctional biosynthetic peptidoglycan transglycosylase